MNYFKNALLTLVALFLFSNINAQTFAQKLKNTVFVFGLSEHIVIDNGKEYQFKFDTKNWNLLPFPSKISAEAYLKKGWSLGTEFAYTSYKANAVVDNVALLKDNTFFSSDFNIRYHFDILLYIAAFSAEPCLADLARIASEPCASQVHIYIYLYIYMYIKFKFKFLLNE